MNSGASHQLFDKMLLFLFIALFLSSLATKSVVYGSKLKLFTVAWANASVFIDLQGVAAERKLTF